MVTIEQKLVLFSKLLNQSMNLKYEEELNRLEKDFQLKIQKAKEKVDKQAQEIEDRAAKKAESRYAESISKSKIAIKRDIMSVKEKYFDMFMNSFRIKLQDFVQSKKYKTYLNKNILKLNNELKKYDNLDLIICLSANDLNEYGDFIKAELSKHHAVNLKTVDITGGFLALVPSRNIKFDLSVDSVLEDNKTFIMQTLLEALKAGEYND